jgi:hypothetical protein
MYRTIKIRVEDYEKAVVYKKKTNLPIYIIIQKAIQRYFADKKLKE